MGRIKTRLIKNIAKRLVKEHPSEFTPGFEKNKPLVQKYTVGASHKMRNSIAGYTARLVKKQTAGGDQRRKGSEEDLSKFYQ